jgi:hypothetical protein
LFGVSPVLYVVFKAVSKQNVRVGVDFWFFYVQFAVQTLMTSKANFIANKMVIIAKFSSLFIEHP